MNDIDREQARRRGIRTALRVAGLAGIVAASVGHAADPPPQKVLPGDANGVDDATRHVRVEAGRGCCGEWRFWGPPAPVAMKRDALARLRAAASALGRFA